MRRHFTSLKQLVPPLLWNLAASCARRIRPEWVYLPGGFSPSSEDGWTDPSVLRTQLAKWETFVQAVKAPGELSIRHELGHTVPEDYVGHNILHSFGYALWRAAQGKSRLRILDWGGGLGHYFLVTRRLAPELGLEYTLHDLPPFCEMARQLVPDAVVEPDRERIVAGSYDLVLLSCSLQYERDWQAAVHLICSIQSPWLLLTRVPVVEKASCFVVRQNPSRYGYSRPYESWVFNRQKLLAAFAPTHTLRHEMLAEPAPRVPGAPERGQMRAFLFSSHDRHPLASASG